MVNTFRLELDVSNLLHLSIFTPTGSTLFEIFFGTSKTVHPLDVFGYFIHDKTLSFSQNTPNKFFTRLNLFQQIVQVRRLIKNE